jgi:PAS domain S-box-containing protein
MRTDRPFSESNVPLRRDLWIFAILGLLGAGASRLNVNIPHTEVFIEARWIFGYMGFLLISRLWVALLLSAFLSAALVKLVPIHLAFLGNLLYALPLGIMLRAVHDRLLLSRHPAMYGGGLFLAVMAGYQMFTTPVVWYFLGILRDAPSPASFVLEGLRTQPFLEESIFVGLILALSMTSLRVHWNLREREEHLATVLRSIGDAVIVTDAEGRVEMLNPAAETLTGWRLSEAGGRLVTEIYRIVNRFSRERVENPVDVVREKGVVVDLANHTVLIGRDGAERQIADSAAPLRTAGGELRGVVMVFRDVTREYLDREALRESEEKYRNLFQMESDAIFLVREDDGRILEANPAAERLYGRSREALLEMTESELVVPAVAESIPRVDFPWIPETLPPRHRKADGTGFPVETGTTPIRWKGADAHILVVRDISERVDGERERRRLEGQLRQAQKMEAIGTLAGGIAHDFNNILFPIIGHAELMKEFFPADDQRKPHLDQILEAAVRAKELVRQILTFSRKSEAEFQPVHIGAVIKESMRMLRSALPAAIRIDSDVRFSGKVMADVTQIQQVLMNLCTNAFHAMEEGGRLRVDVLEEDVDGERAASLAGAKPGRYLVIIVTDTGVGMTAATQARIFDPYFTTKAEGKGTGLGLAIVHGIVKEHRGFLTVESELGKGSRFRVFLPVLEACAKGGILPPPKECPSGKESVLLVDDDSAVRKMMEALLILLGYRVTALASPLEALERVRADSGAFDLVLTDMAMPEMSGESLAAAIWEFRPALPVVVCTGFMDRLDERRWKALGLSGVLTKPVRKSELACMLRDALDGPAQTPSASDRLAGGEALRDSL